MALAACTPEAPACARPLVTPAPSPAAQKPGSFEALLAVLQQKGWEIKRGKQMSFRGPGEKRFKRLDTLGEAYAEETLRAVLAGERVQINTGTFSNDMTTFEDADDVLTLLVHLGYLAYDFEREEVYIPNQEIRKEFYNAVEGAGWTEVVTAIRSSKKLLDAIWNGNEELVAQGMELAHFETSNLQYNDENALSYTVSLALYAARQYYTVIRELPSGKGFADVVYIPRTRYADKPVMVVELKWNKSSQTAIEQIKEKKYPYSLREYQGNMLLVGISYDKKSKRHSCQIEKVVK